ncbi:hypothetical protein DFJ58DRAFT_841960 [Suillus subalutaceus]|uniref:uncharacterized protein n=1 Tax=Suillus subalutaceus TaxID=48586 RepID=UPI001B866DF3|nr:uncharacterized protein DFJ58DRAFT_841960 [Suillus subalutaceus]KAG1852097.1 hypothetical protein DFJ58DRAFT_841960 [Suillus subalutaceus]
MARSQSPIVVLQQNKVPLDKAEVTVLRVHLEDWKSVKGKERAREWLQNHSHQKPSSKPLIKYGRTWTARKVLIHTHKALIQEETGEMAGSGEMISKWPKAAKTVINQLSAEEKEEAQAMADKWNNEAAPPEVQAHVAKTKGADMIEHFATEMFKKAGMRVFVLSTWKDGKGKLMLGGHDFNEQFANSESFMKTRDWEGVFMPEWQEYVGEQFDAEDGEEPQMVKSKKRVPRKLIKLEEDANGWPILPDTKGWKCADQHHMIRSFLTTLYRMCGGKDNIKALVPWGDVIHSQSAFFQSTQWPTGVQFKEPSKMDKADATAVLDFWFDRQQHNIRPAFSFKAWKDADSEMHVAAVSPSATRRTAGNDHQDAQCSNSDKHDDGGLSGAIDLGAQSTGEEEEISLGRQYTPTPRTNSNSAEVGNPMKAKGATSRRNVSNTLADIGDTVNVAILNGSGNARQPDQSQKTLKEAVAAGTCTRSKAAANISNERPKGLKQHAADPVSDTPAKRTRSKATALAASKSKRK